MSKELSNRIEELIILGWTEEGASKYAQKFLNGNSLEISFTSDQILILTVFASAILIAILIIIFQRLRSQIRNNDLFTLKEKDKVINKIEFQSLGELKMEYKENLNNKDFESIGENIHVEFIRDNEKNNGIDSEKNLYKYNEEEDSIINDTPTTKDFTKNNLSFKSSAELQNILNSIPKISHHKDLKFDSLEQKLIVLNKNKIQYIKYFIRLFKETSIDINNLIEHFLLIILLSIEGLFNLFSSLKTFNDELITGIYKMKSRNIQLDKRKESKNISFDERKKVLMNKKNSELRYLLKTETNISRLRKSELVDKILILEFGTF